MTALAKQVEDNDFPGLYRAASQLSADSQSIFFLCFATHMVLLALAAAISVINSPYPEVAIIQSVTLLGALFCAVYLYWGRPDQDWYTGRAVAESIKTMCWRYMMHSFFRHPSALSTACVRVKRHFLRRQ